MIIRRGGNIHTDISALLFIADVQAKAKFSILSGVEKHG